MSAQEPTFLRPKLWAQVVGPQIAAVTTPDRLVRSGGLEVAVTTWEWAHEFAAMEGRIRERLLEAGILVTNIFYWRYLGPPDEWDDQDDDETAEWRA